MIHVRPAVVGEVATVSAHLNASQEESSAYRGHLDRIDVPDPKAIVVTLDDTVVGSAGYGDSHGVRTITHLYVVPECREVGAGDALMEWIIDDAAGAGLSAVRSSALPGDRATKNLFERHGLIARAIQVERRLS